MLKHIIFWGLLCLSGYLFWAEYTITHGPGVVAPSEPVQEPAFGINDLEHEEFKISPLAEFNIEARVLSKKQYSSDRLSEIAPLDVVLGWGPMSDERNLNEILITQSDRYFNWQMTNPPIPLHKMVRHTANIHLVPSSEEIEQKIRKIRKGHIIDMEGFLAEISTKEGWSLKSSLKREDYGDKASELIWIEDLQLRP